MNASSAFGSWLKQRRKALDLTQADLAGQVGCALTTLQKIELGKRRPSKQVAERLADVLAVSLDERAAFVTFARRVAPSTATLSVDLTSFTPTHNLPSHSTPLVGREDELAQIAERLTDPNCQLLTLVGPGGIGKTRLALQAAAAKLGDFADGVYFVSLAPVSSTSMIASAIASALQLSFSSEDDPNVQVVNYMHGKHMLLIMDNFEHLLDGIDLLTDMLANAPRLKILATSRERLNMQEEWALPIKGLPYPPQETSDEVDSYSAIQLFIQSAHRVQPGFSLAGNHGGVIAICQAVEGMPLGIELAATWLRVMPCQQIAAQIRRDLDFLATPLRNASARHRSLRAVFEHSWGLLSAAERSALMNLSVFRGGFDPEAAAQVAGASLVLLAGLGDKSLIRALFTGRYEMHELLRQFVADKLREANETAEIQRRHFEFFLNLAETLEGQLSGSQHVSSMDRLEAEHDNFRAALDWILRAEDAQAGLRLAGALGWFWGLRGFAREARDWLDRFLSMGQDVPVAVRAKALHHVLEMSSHLGDEQYTALHYSEALTVAREVREPRLAAWLLGIVGYAEGSPPEHRPARLKEALALFRQLGDQWATCMTLSRLGYYNLEQGDFAVAGELLDEGLRLARQTDDKSVLAWLLLTRASVNLYQGITDQRTERMYLASLALFRELHHKDGMTKALARLGRIAYSRGEDAQARTLYGQSLILSQQIGSKAYIALSLIRLGQIFCTHGEPERGAHLQGAAANLGQKFLAGRTLQEKDAVMHYEQGIAAARAQLGEAGFAAAYTEGQMMSLEQAIAFALRQADHNVL